jgi:hypothetical protein
MLLLQDWYAWVTYSQNLIPSKGAWFVPMIAVSLNYVFKALSSNVPARHTNALKNRIGLYLSIMAFRTVVLYMGLNAVEEVLFPQASSCWYSSLRKNGKCIKVFDHADHIVLYMVHFLSISCFEWKMLRWESISVLRTLIVRLWLALVMTIALYAIYQTSSSFHR